MQNVKRTELIFVYKMRKKKGRIRMYYFTLFVKKTLRYLLKPLSIVPALLMMYVIYSLSAQDSLTSSHLSGEVSKYIVLAYNKICMKGYDNATLNALIKQIHPYVRKGAHVTEYLLLAMSVALPLYVYRIRGFLLTLIAGVFCVSFAAFDEYHQSFVAGRVCDYHDVMIDSIGILVGIIAIMIICSIARKTLFSWLVLDNT